MSLLVVTAIVFSLLILLLTMRAPVGFALAIAGIVGIVLFRGWDVTNATLRSLPFSETSNYVLIAVPMFIFMGIVATNTTMAEDAFAVASRFLYKIPGGLAVATVLACGGFAAISGSSTGTMAAIGRLSIREMRANGYKDELAGGIVASAGTLGVLIPPSILLVIYGFVSGESVGKLLLAGIIPGVITAVAYALTILFRSLRNPEMVGRAANPSERQEFKPRPIRLSNMVGVVQVGIILGVIIGGIYGGVFTVIESSAVAALVSLLILIFHRFRNGQKGVIHETFVEAININGVVFAIVIGAAIFSWFTVTSGLTREFADWIVSLELAPNLVILLVLGALIPMGMFLDAMSIVLIATPILHPVATGLGYDGIWFAIMVVKLVEVSLVTPPVGINVFVLAGLQRDLKAETIFKGALPFLAVDLALVLLLLAFPGIVTWLPSGA